MKLLKNWGDYADMSQGVVVYLTFTSDVLLVCWLGTQLTKHVSEKLLIIFLRRYVHNGKTNSCQYFSVLSGLLRRVFCQIYRDILKKTYGGLGATNSSQSGPVGWCRRWGCCLRRCATSRNVASSIQHDVIRQAAIWFCLEEQ